MSVKANKIKSGYTELTPDEQNEVKAFIKKYDDSSYFEKSNLNESMAQIVNKAVAARLTSHYLV